MIRSPGTCVFELQAAVFERLGGDSIIKNAGANVFDGSADPDSSYPYVVIDSWTAVPDNRLSSFGQQATCAVHTYSNYEGVRDVALIAGAIQSALEEQVMLTKNWNVTKVAFEIMNTLREGNEVRHAISRYRFWVTPK